MDAISPSQRHLVLCSDRPVESPKPVVEFTRSLAVVIGINDYRHGIPALKTAARDAEELARILHTDYGYEVRLLTHDVALAQLRTLLRDELPRQVNADDRVVVYFAGHGIALEGDDGPAGYLVPQDGRPEDRSTFLRMDEFHDALMALDCRHMLIILDCCFAGAMRWASTRALTVLPEVIHRERYERFIRDPAWQVITSAAYDQKALDVLAGDVVGARGDAAGQHSPFALALFEALRGAGDLVPAGGGDGVITAAELYLYLRDYVEVKAEETVGHYQTPGLWPLKKHGKGEYIFLTPGHELNLPPAPELTYENNPYRGLQAFEEKHADLFFGRTALVETLAETVTSQPLTVVLGASGTGKSSVVKAGLLPYLRNAGSDASAWHILPPMRPTETPLHELEYLLCHHLPDLGEVSASHASPRSLTNLVTYWARTHPGQKLILVIDQFEELVTLCRHDAEREQFIRLLTMILDACPEQVRVILTLRSDFEPQFSGSALHARWTAARFVVPPMSQAELREAIEGPASVRVLYFEPPALVDRLIDEVIQTPGALPLLSFTLSELYIKYVERRSDDRALNQADYEALGGVVGSLRNRATEEYDKLDAAHRATMRRVLLRMVASEGGELARRRVPRAELIYPDEAENARVKEIIECLDKARLVVRDKTQEDVPYVEPAHDALVRAWDKLLTWHREAEDYLPLQRRLTQAADEWAAEANERTKTDLLWNEDPRLPQVEQVLAGNPETVKRSWVAHQWLRFRDLWRTTPLQAVEGHWLNQLELDFVQRSVEQRRKDGRRLVGTVVGVMVVLVALTLFALFQANRANIAQATAEAERDTAISRQLAVQSQDQLDQHNWETGFLLAIEAGRTSETTEAFTALRQALAHPGRVSLILPHVMPALDATWNNDGTRILTANADGTVRVWDVSPNLTQTGVELLVLTGHKGEVTQATWNADESRILSVGVDHTVRVWDAKTGALLTVLSSHSAEIRQAMWNVEGGAILTASADGTARIWDAETGTVLSVLSDHQAALNQAVWNSDGSRILTTGNDGTARVWRLDFTAIGMLPTELFAITDPDATHLDEWNTEGYRAAWSADESLILTWGNAVRVWDAETGQELYQNQLLRGRRAWWYVDYYGQRILTLGCDIREPFASCLYENTARIWDVETEEEKAIFFVGGQNSFPYADWNSDGQFLLTACAQARSDKCLTGEVQIWGRPDTGDETPILISSLLLPTGATQRAAWDASGQRILTASGNVVLIWDIQAGYEIPSLSGYSAWWNVDGSRIATADADQTVQVRDTQTGQSLLTLDLEELFTIHVTHVAWNHDENRLLTIGNGVQVWNTSPLQFDDTSSYSPPVITEPVVKLTGSTATWNTEGNRILVANWNWDGTMGVWEISEASGFTGDVQPLFTFALPEDMQEGGWINHLVWSADERLVLAAGGIMKSEYSTEGTVRIWDISSLDQHNISSIQRPNELLVLSGHTDMVNQAVWNDDKTRILTASDDGAVHVWRLSSSHENTPYTAVQELVLPAHSEWVNQALWSADENYILTTGCDQRHSDPSRLICVKGSARLWRLLVNPAGEIQAAIEQLVFAHHTGEVFQAAWNGNGSRLLVAGCDETDRTGSECFRGITYQYYTHIKALWKTACQRACRNMPRQEWLRFFGDEPYRATCPDLPEATADIE